MSCAFLLPPPSQHSSSAVCDAFVHVHDPQIQGLLSIRVGQQCRQGNIDGKKPFKFTASPEELKSMKIDVLQTVGGARVLAVPGAKDRSHPSQGLAAVSCLLLFPLSLFFSSLSSLFLSFPSLSLSKHEQRDESVIECAKAQSAFEPAS